MERKEISTTTNEGRFAVVNGELTTLFQTEKVAKAFAEREGGKVITLIRKRLCKVF